MCKWWPTFSVAKPFVLCLVFAPCKVRALICSHVLKKRNKEEEKQQSRRSALLLLIEVCRSSSSEAFIHNSLVDHVNLGVFSGTNQYFLTLVFLSVLKSCFFGFRDVKKLLLLVLKQTNYWSKISHPCVTTNNFLPCVKQLFRRIVSSQNGVLTSSWKRTNSGDRFKGSNVIFKQMCIWILHFTLIGLCKHHKVARTHASGSIHL